MGIERGAMKITLQVNDATIEWDSSMCDDRIEVNQIARDVAGGKFKPSEILERYVKRNAQLMSFVCPVCIANGLADEPKPTDERQAGLFDGE
jgi:hypothetical protein